jgi:glucosyl-3-phosphoglycerate phosphatase
VTAPDPAALPVPRLLIWRHGRTEWNATGRFQGQLDPPLDAEGRNQAARVAPHLVAAGLSPDDTVVVSSDLVRAAETAAVLAELLGVPLTLDPRLREHGLGTWEGLTRDEVAARYPEQYADWVAGRPVRDRGGEQPASVAERALAAVADLPPVGAAVLVTHGGTAGRLLEALLGLGADHRRLFGPLGNCAWSELTRQSGRWRLVRHNSWVAPLTESMTAAPGAAALHTVPTTAGNGSAPASSATPDERAATPDGDADAVG